MKKTWVLAFVLFLASSVSFAQGKVVMGLGGVVGIPASTETANALNAGFGGTAHFGYALDETFTIGVAGGYRTHSIQTEPYRDMLYALAVAMGAPVSIAEHLAADMSISGSLDYVPILAEVRCNFMTGQVKPFGVLGIGVALNSFSAKAVLSEVSSSNTASEVAFLVSPALGVAFAASDKVDIFIQAGVDLDLTSNNGSVTRKVSFADGDDVISMDFASSLTGDSPTIFIPFEVGVLFSLQ